MDLELKTTFDSKSLDIAIKKAKQLVEILREAQQIADSLSELKP